MTAYVVIFWKLVPAGQEQGWAMLLHRGRDDIEAGARLGPGYEDPDPRLRRAKVAAGSARTMFQLHEWQ